MKTEEYHLVQLKEILDRISDGFVALDKDWNYTYVNKLAGEILEREPVQLIGKNIWTEFPEGIGQQFHLLYEKAMKEQRYQYLLAYYQPFDRWFENHIYPSPKGLSIYFKDVTEKIKNDKHLADNEQLFRSLTANAPVAIFKTDIKGACDYVNEEWMKYSGMHFEEAMGYGWSDAIHPEEKVRVLEEWRLAISSGTEFRSEFRFLDKNRKATWLEVKAVALYNTNRMLYGYIGMAIDITERKNAELYMAGEKIVMEMIATEKPMEEILKFIALNYESFSENALCSILLLNEEGTHVRHGAGPSLPAAFNNGIDGEPIGPVAGSCGTAAYRKERVIVKDIANDPLWVNYRDFALSFGLKASWSSPIIDTNGKVLATFAIYYKECCLPSEDDLKFIDRSANQVKIVLQRYYKDNQVKKSEKLYRSLFENLLHGFAYFKVILKDDQVENIIYLNTNSEYRRIFGLEINTGDKSSELIPGGLDSDPDYKELLFKVVKHGETIKYETFFKPLEKWFFLSIYNVENEYCISIVEDITERKKTEQTIKKEVELSDSVINSLPGIFYMSDQTPKLLRWNRELEIYTGYSAEELGNMIPSTIIYPDDLAVFRKAIEKTYNEGTADVEVHLYSKDRKKIPFYFTGVRISYEGKPVILGTGINITERKIAEEKIKLLNDELEKRVSERTTELEVANADLKEINDLFVGNEIKIIELKEELAALKLKVKP